MGRIASGLVGVGHANEGAVKRVEVLCWRDVGELIGEVGRVGDKAVEEVRRDSG